MKISLIGSRAFDSLEYHVGESLRVLGHEVLQFDVSDVSFLSARANYWVSRFSESYDRLIGLRLAGKVIAERPDLVLVVYRNLHPILVDEIKKGLPGVSIVQINPDALSNLEKQQIIAANFDHYFSKEPFIVEFLRDKAGINAHYLPEGFNPRVHQRPETEKAVAERETNIDVLVFGSLYAYRARMVDQLIRAGVNVAVYGTTGPYLLSSIKSAFREQLLIGERKNRILYGAKIVFNNFHYAEVTSVNQKYFEINGIGAFQLCDYKPALDEYTAVSAERVTYRTMNEAIDKIRYYLAYPSERYQIADQQYLHFQQNHTFDLRMKEMLSVIGYAESIRNLESSQLP
ncbi:glycosyltransferase [Spirosoma aureum]|uniref:Glycosyltransferase n=1 Tax=Spirosoma aureum TaxID=2692134 RepID=A0A6G9AV79_9BACT|nr:glycosyltransferase [Spirosoma aureum]QIP16239.1 glycosyltransferase [Spirosoma aureum]